MRSEMCNVTATTHPYNTCIEDRQKKCYATVITIAINDSQRHWTQLFHDSTLPAMHGHVYCVGQTAQILHIMIINVEEMNGRLTVMPCNQQTNEQTVIVVLSPSFCSIYLSFRFVLHFLAAPEVIKFCRSHWRISATIASEMYRIEILRFTTAATQYSTNNSQFYLRMWCAIARIRTFARTLLYVSLNQLTFFSHSSWSCSIQNASFNFYSAQETTVSTSDTK